MITKAETSGLPASPYSVVSAKDIYVAVKIGDEIATWGNFAVGAGR